MPATVWNGRCNLPVHNAGFLLFAVRIARVSVPILLVVMRTFLAIYSVSGVCDIRSLAPWHELDDMACCEVLENDIYLFCAGIS